MNRGMQFGGSVPFFAKSVDLRIFFFKSETTIKVNVNAIVTCSKEGNMLDGYNTVQL